MSVSYAREMIESSHHTYTDTRANWKCVCVRERETNKILQSCTPLNLSKYNTMSTHTATQTTNDFRFTHPLHMLVYCIVVVWSLLLFDLFFLLFSFVVVCVFTLHWFIFKPVAFVSVALPFQWILFKDRWPNR